MTDRIKGFIVTLENDIREDDCEHIINAIKMVKGVIDVSPSISDSSDHMNRERVKYELKDKFYSFMKKELL